MIGLTSAVLPIVYRIRIAGDRVGQLKLTEGYIYVLEVSGRKVFTVLAGGAMTGEGWFGQLGGAERILSMT